MVLASVCDRFCSGNCVLGKFGHWGGQPYDVYEDSNGTLYLSQLFIAA